MFRATEIMEIIYKKNVNRYLENMGFFQPPLQNIIADYLIEDGATEYKLKT